MTTTESATDDPVEDYYAGGCIVDCGWRDVEGDHGPYCERSVGSDAHGFTEPNRIDTQFWCSVISPRVDGTLSRSQAAEARKGRDGVQLSAMAPGEMIIDTETQQGWSEIRFNMTSAEARSLAAHLIAAADSRDHIDSSAFISRRLDKLADRLGVDISGA